MRDAGTRLLPFCELEQYANVHLEAVWADGRKTPMRGWLTFVELDCSNLRQLYFSSPLIWRGNAWHGIMRAKLSFPATMDDYCVGPAILSNGLTFWYYLVKGGRLCFILYTSRRRKMTFQPIAVEECQKFMDELAAAFPSLERLYAP